MPGRRLRQQAPARDPGGSVRRMGVRGGPGAGPRAGSLRRSGTGPERELGSCRCGTPRRSRPAARAPPCPGPRRSGSPRSGWFPRPPERRPAGGGGTLRAGPRCRARRRPRVARGPPPRSRDRGSGTALHQSEAPVGARSGRFRGRRAAAGAGARSGGEPALARPGTGARRRTGSVGRGGVPGGAGGDARFGGPVPRGGRGGLRRRRPGRRARVVRVRRPKPLGEQAPGSPLRAGRGRVAGRRAPLLREPDASRRNPPGSRAARLRGPRGPRRGTGAATRGRESLRALHHDSGGGAHHPRTARRAPGGRDRRTRRRPQHGSR